MNAYAGVRTLPADLPSLGESQTSCDPEADALFERRCKRFRGWALKQDKDKLVNTLTMLAVEYMALRKLRRLMEKIDQYQEDSLMHAKEYKIIARELIVISENRRSRQRDGGKKRHAGTDSARAKKQALALWPEAKRKGWTAVQFHTALVGAKHKIAFDTARKWLTKLRKTGVC